MPKWRSPSFFTAGSVPFNSDMIPLSDVEQANERCFSSPCTPARSTCAAKQATTQQARQKG